MNLQPRDVHEALESLKSASAQLRARGDARAVFPDVYAVITRRVCEAIEGRGGPSFADPTWMSRLAGRFAEYYLETLLLSLREQAPAASAWQLAHGVPARRATTPMQEAALGINAHINYDLALGVRDVIVADGHAHDLDRLRRYKRDFDAINQILEAAVPEVLELLVRRYDCRLTRVVIRLPSTRGVVIGVVLRVLKIWREQVWADTLELLAQGPGAEARVRARMDRRSGLIARALLASRPQLNSLWLGDGLVRALAMG